MRLLILVITICCMLVSYAYGLDEETKDGLISLYNYTRNNYIVVEGLIDDFTASKLEASAAEAKLDEWKKRYSEKVHPTPNEAKKMCELMLTVFDTAKELIHDYQPQNLKTKNLLDELDKAKSALIDEMTAIKYLVQ